MKNRYRCTAISDTHTMHEQVKLSGGDILFHTGDSTYFGQKTEVYPFIDWLAEQDYKHKIFIAGNHELGFEDPSKGAHDVSKEGMFYFRSRMMFKHGSDEFREYARRKGVIYLEHETTVLDGIKIFGSPYQPFFHAWAFQYANDKEGDELFSKIPEDTDILLTHGPSYDNLDRNVWDHRCGCPVLGKHIERVKPKFHICGHVHGGYGQKKENGIRYINASTCTERYKPTNKPINFYYDRG